MTPPPVLVVAPHPDDETLGCGGTLLRHQADGAAVHWLLGTQMHADVGHAPDQIARRAAQLQAVAARYGFASVTSLGWPTTTLDTVPQRDLVGRIADVFRQVAPGIVYLPFAGDAHSDHRALFEAASACCKWFRAPSVKRVLCYETLSETDASLDPTAPGFHPNVFVDISRFLDAKLQICDLYADELGEFPFPRSRRAVQALASVRGAAAGFAAAEAFVLLKEIQ